MLCCWRPERSCFGRNWCGNASPSQRWDVSPVSISGRYPSPAGDRGRRCRLCGRWPFADKSQVDSGRAFLSSKPRLQPVPLADEAFMADVERRLAGDGGGRGVVTRKLHCSARNVSITSTKSWNSCSPGFSASTCRTSATDTIRRIMGPSALRSHSDTNSISIVLNRARWRSLVSAARIFSASSPSTFSVGSPRRSATI